MAGPAKPEKMDRGGRGYRKWNRLKKNGQGAGCERKKDSPAAPSASYDVRLFRPLDSQQRKIQ